MSRTSSPFTSEIASNIRTKTCARPKPAPHAIPGLELVRHEFELPLDYAQPGRTLRVFVREVVAPGKDRKELPCLVFFQGGPGSGSPLMMVELRQLGGALRRIEPGSGAAAMIDAQFVLFSASVAMDADMGAMIAGYAGGMMDAMEPWAARGRYLNFAEHKVDTSESYEPTSYARLRAVKERVNPDHVIRANHEL